MLTQSSPLKQITEKEKKITQDRFWQQNKKEDDHKKRPELTGEVAEIFCQTRTETKIVFVNRPTFTHEGLIRGRASYYSPPLFLFLSLLFPIPHEISDGRSSHVRSTFLSGR